jgi:hypothetical protein
MQRVHRVIYKDLRKLKPGKTAGVTLYAASAGLLSRKASTRSTATRTRPRASGSQSALVASRPKTSWREWLAKRYLKDWLDVPLPN